MRTCTYKIIAYNLIVIVDTISMETIVCNRKIYRCITSVVL